MTIKVTGPGSVKFNPLRTLSLCLSLKIKKKLKKRKKGEKALKGFSFRSKAVSDTKLI